MHLLQDPAFWVLVSFVVFFVLVGKPVWKGLTGALDSRSAQIRAELDQAIILREEAQAILATYQKKERESLEEAERIVAQTKADADAMATRAEEELRVSLEKRKALAMNKIAQAEAKALQAVQENVVDIAIAAARSVVIAQLGAGESDELLALATADIERKIH